MGRVVGTPKEPFGRFVEHFAGPSRDVRGRAGEAEKCGQAGGVLARDEHRVHLWTTVNAGGWRYNFHYRVLLRKVRGIDEAEDAFRVSYVATDSGRSSHEFWSIRGDLLLVAFTGLAVIPRTKMNRVMGEVLAAAG